MLARCRVAFGFAGFFAAPLSFGEEIIEEHDPVAEAKAVDAATAKRKPAEAKPTGTACIPAECDQLAKVNAAFRELHASTSAALHCPRGQVAQSVYGETK